MNELAGDMQIWAVGAQSVWQAVGFEKTAKKPTKCTGTRQADGLLMAYYADTVVACGCGQQDQALLPARNAPATCIR